MEIKRGAGLGVFLTKCSNTELWTYICLYLSMFKKIILIIIVGILSIQIFPIHWVDSIVFDNNIEQKMPMNEAEEDLEIEFSKVIKEKIYDNELSSFNVHSFEQRNLVHFGFYISSLQNTSSQIICPPPNHV